MIQQDPVLQGMKLIAEPWDVREAGYHVGNFPPGWSEWNGRYRDNVRDLWRGAEGRLAEFGCRFTGSADLYEASERRPHASVNFVTAHDGFTLRDLVSYDRKHNEANGEENRDGSDDNRSWGCGAEGETADAAVNALRARQQRNLLVTLLLSQGVPMILHGDEMGRTQRGNNNAYCQDSELSWMDWTGADWALLEFTRRLVAFRQRHPVFRRRQHLRGERAWHDSVLPDILWVRPAKAIGVFLNGDGLPPDARGLRVVDHSYLVAVNAHHDDLEFVLPAHLGGAGWVPRLDTAAIGREWDRGTPAAPGSRLLVTGRSVRVFERVGGP